MRGLPIRLPSFKHPNPQHKSIEIVTCKKRVFRFLSQTFTIHPKFCLRLGIGIQRNINAFSQFPKYMHGFHPSKFYNSPNILSRLRIIIKIMPTQVLTLIKAQVLKHMRDRHEWGRE
jgi:hypothetical protein